MIPLRNIRRFILKAAKQPGYAARVFTMRMLAAAYYTSGSGRSAMPEAITFFLTYRCNLRCKMCGQWGDEGVTRQNPGDYINGELSYEELSRVVDEVSVFNPGITLFGGEPLLHPDCVRLIGHIKKKGMNCLMITNGYLLAESAQTLVESGLDELNVSLDGGRELHDTIRGMPGLFDKIMRGFHEVSRCKKAMGRSKPLINLQCTITKYNYRRLEDMIAVAGEAHADSLTFHNLIFTDTATLEKQREYDKSLGCSSAAWEGFVCDPGIDPRELYKILRGILKKKYPFNVDVYPNFSHSAFMEYYRNDRYKPADYSCRCLSPWITAYLFPDGTVRPCLNSTYSYGTIRREKFRQIWNSEEAVKYRAFLKAHRIFPACVRCTELYRY